MNIDFEGQTVLVTGASRGIGRQIAEDFKEAGATLIVTSTKGRDSTSHWSADVRHLAADFSDPQSTKAFIEEVRALERLDVCVNNAGLSRHGTLQDATEEDWWMTNEVNLKAPFFLMQAAADVMKRASYGRMVGISSVWGHVSMPERTIYAATKFGIRGLTVSAAVELAPFGILVNDVAPGFTLTDMVLGNYSDAQRAAMAAKVPLGRLAEPKEIASSVLFLASRQNSYITGQSLVVDGGFCVA